MCGFVCILNLSRDHRQIEYLHRMNDRIYHRGPDDEGYMICDSDLNPKYYGGEDTVKIDESNHFEYADYYPRLNIEAAYNDTSYLLFGHRRLSILDLSVSGHQPMSYLDKYTIIFNGEIFNFLELKEELIELGYFFFSNSDTEVILAAYDMWGSECQSKFNGFWAFIILDIKSETLFISRDRLGIKPLYYYYDKDKVIFASEIKSILANPTVDTSPNINYINKYLKDGPREFIKETSFNNIYHFDSASFVEKKIQQFIDGNISEQKYWKINADLSNEPFEFNKALQFKEKYLSLLTDSIKIRLRADVKIGTALSGGLDSSTICFIVNKLLKDKGDVNQQITFSSVYSEINQPNVDESEFIFSLSKKLNTKSFTIQPNADEVKINYEKMISAMENLPNGTHMSGYFVYKLVNEKNVTVTIDGQGADEQLAGYLGYIRNYLIYIPLSRLKDEIRQVLKIHNVRKLNVFIGVLFNLFNKILGNKLFNSIMSFFFPNYFFLHLNEALKQSTTNGILTNLLHYSDSLSMVNSVESRLPFLDYRVIEFLASIPVSYKVHNGWTKYISRFAMSNLLPDNIVWRKDKMGWPQPDEIWLKGELKEWVVDTINQSAFLEDKDKKRVIDKFISNRISIEKLIRIINLCIWYKIFFNNEKYCIGPERVKLRGF
jgi:asparagine synthase (glutamine-hydrolysing)